MKHITEDIEDLAHIVSKCLIKLESIEDNILVTKTGNDVLSKGIPKTIEEIESIQKQNKN